MYQDPLFLIGLTGAIGCIGWWILDNLRGEGSEELEENLNRIGLIFSVLIIWRLFVNAGDLGILLFFGSIICLLILLAGVIASNSRLTKTGRSWFIPVFLIFALRTFAYEPFQIPSGSMLPGLKVGDFLLVNKHVYGYKINRIGEPKNNKIPKSPAFTNNLQMIKTEKINPIRLRFSSSSSEPSPLRLSNIHQPMQPMAPVNPIKNNGS
jgi:hypothetical protein